MTIAKTAKGFRYPDGNEKVSETHLRIQQGLEDVDAYLSNLDMKQVWATAAANVTNATWTALSLDNLNASGLNRQRGVLTNIGQPNTTSLSVGVDMDVDLTCGVNWAAASAGRRIVSFAVQAFGGAVPTTPNPAYLTDSRTNLGGYQYFTYPDFHLTASDRVWLFVYQDSGATIQVTNRFLKIARKW